MLNLLNYPITQQVTNKNSRSILYPRDEVKGSNIVHLFLRLTPLSEAGD